MCFIMHQTQDRMKLKLEMLGISHLADRGYAELSGGERQLVLIARALFVPFVG